MSANKEIRILMLQEGINIAKLAAKICENTNFRYTPDGLSKKLRNNTLKFIEAEMIADVLDYDVVFKKRK